MAPCAPSSHTFQKLKLDTAKPLKPVTSTFAALSRHDASADDTPAPSVGAPLVSAPAACSSGLVHGRRSWHDEAETGSPRHGPFGDAATASGVGPATSFAGPAASFAGRHTSITFDSQVTLECGDRLAIEEPLPKFALPDAAISDSSHGDDYDDANLYMNRPLEADQRLPHGEPGFDILPPASAAHIAAHEDAVAPDNVASLTSEETASPVLDEVHTPGDPPADLHLPPRPVGFAIRLPLSPPQHIGLTRRPSYRSELGDGDCNTRRASRRSSTRSRRSVSSMSPAASFLARYKASTSEGAVKAPEPDDEGQGIGYEGEYIIGKQVGFGGFSVVKEVTSIEDGERVVHAVKIVRKQVKDQAELDNERIQTQFDHEVEIWRFLRHAYVLPLLRVYNTDFATFCITLLNKGGTLFDMIREHRRKNRKGLPLHLAKRYAYQLASALRYLHNDVQIVHRDVKLENCLVDMTVPRAQADGGHLLLCDFGMADFIVSDQRDGPEPRAVDANPNMGAADTSTTVAGSLQYAAPELFDAPGPVFSTAADMWAFGVVVYALLTAQLPFNEGLDAKTAMRIQRGDWNVDALRDAVASQEGGGDAMGLVNGCLQMSVDKRWNVHSVLACEWMKGCAAVHEHVSRPWLVD